MAKKKSAAKKTTKKRVTKHSAQAIAKFNPMFHSLLTMGLADSGAVKGSCVWTDPMGNFHCVNNVTKAACDNLQGKFDPGGDC